MEPDESMRIPSMLRARTTSSSGAEVDLFATRRHQATLTMKYVKKYNTTLGAGIAQSV
jgi:hypothetical protein